MSLYSIVEYVQGALTESHDVILAVMGRVNRAHALLNQGLLEDNASTAKWSWRINCTVEVHTVLGHVGCGALNALAASRSQSVGIVEASKPQRADIGSEGPFTDPDIVLNFFRCLHERAVFVAVLTDLALPWPPGKVLVCIHHYVLVVVIIEHLVPEAGIKVESIVENKLEAWLLLFHHRADIPVELHQHVQVRRAPRLINWLNGVQSLMVTPGVQQTLNGILRPVDVVLVD